MRELLSLLRFGRHLAGGIDGLSLRCRGCALFGEAGGCAYFAFRRGFARLFIASLTAGSAGFFLWSCRAGDETCDREGENQFFHVG